MLRETKEILNLIIDDALQGKINLEQFYNRWPKELNNDRFYHQMFEDIENAIEHTPFIFFTKKLKYNEWIKTQEYRRLLFYKSSIN